jgi:nucleotide-binding universal stress UspA family protein
MRTILAGADIDNRVNCLVLRGEARRVISAQLRKLNIATLVMGKHTRRKGSATAPDGSVCRYLTYFAPVDVLVVP